MSDIQEEQKRLYKRAEENDKKILEKELEELRDIFNYEKDLRIKSEKEINRLNNIINELEEWLEEKQDLTCGCGITPEYIYAYENTLDYLNELKGDNK